MAHTQTRKQSLKTCTHTTQRKTRSILTSCLCSPLPSPLTNISTARAALLFSGPMIITKTTLARMMILGQHTEIRAVKTAAQGDQNLRGKCRRSGSGKRGWRDRWLGASRCLSASGVIRHQPEAFLGLQSRAVAMWAGFQSVWSGLPHEIMVSVKWPSRRLTLCWRCALRTA